MNIVGCSRTEGGGLGARNILDYTGAQVWNTSLQAQGGPEPPTVIVEATVDAG